MHTPVGRVGVREIALLQGQPPEIIPHHGTRFVQRADQKVGKGLRRPMLRLRLGVLLRLRLRLCLHVLLRLCLHVLLWVCMDVLLRLMDRLGLRLWRLSSWIGCRGLEPAAFKLHEPTHCVELGPQACEPGILFLVKLFDEVFELSFLGLDLLFQQVGPVLQIPANITHCSPLPV